VGATSRTAQAPKTLARRPFATTTVWKSTSYTTPAIDPSVDLSTPFFDGELHSHTLQPGRCRSSGCDELALYRVDNVVRGIRAEAGRFVGNLVLRCDENDKNPGGSGIPFQLFTTANEYSKRE
jgi:hypothetical protein